MNPSLSFDEKTQLYRHNGIIVPRVTGMLEEFGLSEDYTKDPWYRERGKAVHEACGLWATGDLWHAGTSKYIMGYVQSLDAFCAKYGFKIEHSELPLYSSIWRFAGRLDLKGKLDGRNTILDLKTGVIPPSADLQTAAYSILYRENFKENIERRLVLRLNPDGSLPRHEEYTNHDHDERLFLSVVAVWHRKHRS